MKRARMNAYFGTLTEDVFDRANDVQKIVLHHIKLLVKSLNDEEHIRED